MRWIFNIPQYCCIAIVRLYQLILSPFLGGHCRFHPTCSAYAIEALHKYGAMKGSAKAAWRIIRCNPLGGCGHDPP
jgi:hypothetical protein